MANLNREDCLFRQLESNPESIPKSLASAFEVFAAMETEPESPGEVAEALSAMEAPVCPIEDCKISLMGLLRYVTSAGAEAPRQELDEAAAPSCILLDVPHEIDRILGQFAWPDDPRNEE